MMKNSNDVKLAIIKATNNVRKKYAMLKSENIDTDLLLEKNFKPIIEPLKILVENNNFTNRSNFSNGVDIKREMKIEKQEFNGNKTNSELHDDEDYDSFNDTDDSFKTITDDRIETDTSFTFDPNEYINDSLYSRSGMDTTFGIRYENNQFKLGNSLIKFDNDKNFIINGEKFTSTHGLFELLFKKLPDKNIYDQHDLLIYQDIGAKTNLFYRKYDKQSNINGNSSKKYSKIVSKLVEKKKNGGSRKKVGNSLKKISANKKNKIIKLKPVDSSCINDNVLMNLSKPSVIFWDDINELVGRLRLITSSTIAGNDVHQNEIISIIEELREENFIE